MLDGRDAILAADVALNNGINKDAIWLAFAPGGVAEMTLISLALGIDVAFVSTHHLVRVVFMVIVAPLIFHFIDGRWGLREDPNDHKF